MTYNEAREKRNELITIFLSNTENKGSDWFRSEEAKRIKNQVGELTQVMRGIDQQIRGYQREQINSIEEGVKWVCWAFVILGNAVLIGIIFKLIFEHGIK